ncbi:MAG: glutathione S-transferase family protein [Rhodoferax sp.]|jgi:glutathione S-transferase|nr:glutathione S-transferase family protein [Rhodoferax sp.]
MSYTLYGSPDSANAVVRTALEELAQPYQDVLVDRGAAAQHSAAYRALNPQGLLPVLVVPGQDEPLFETAAILLFLADRHAALLPQAPSARGRGLKWLFFLSNTLHADLRVLFYSARYVSDEAAIPSLRVAMHRRVEAHFGLLDAEIARHGGPWLLGEALSVCDLYLAWCARWAQLYPVGDTLPGAALAARPRLWSLLEALQQRPAVQRACQREEVGLQAFTAPVVPQPSRGSVTG